MQSCHGNSFMIPSNSLTMKVHLNASGTLGVAITSDNRWLQVQWPASWQEVVIPVLKRWFQLSCRLQCGEGVDITPCVLSFRQHGSSGSCTGEVDETPSPAALVALPLILCSILSVLL